MSTPADGRLRVLVDRTRCIGAATCVLEAPTVFALDDDHQAVARIGPEVDPDEVRHAVEGCPTGALALIADEGDHLVSP